MVRLEKIREEEDEALLEIGKDTTIIARPIVLGHQASIAIPVIDEVGVARELLDQVQLGSDDETMERIETATRGGKSQGGAMIAMSIVALVTSELNAPAEDVVEVAVHVVMVVTAE